MKLRIKKRLGALIFPHLPAVLNPAGHMPPFLKKTLLFILRITHKKTFDRLNVLKIMFGPLKGKKMILNLKPENGSIDTEYLAGYRQEKEEIELIKKLTLQGKIIWDIGIYRGFYSLLFSDLTGPTGKVIAFDLEKKNCKVVKELAYLNGITNLTVYNCGISNENIESDFISSPSSNSRLIGTFRGAYTTSPVLTKGENISTVKLRTLNSLFEEFGKADLIKMDIDGAELFALDTADRIFENQDLIFIIESHNHETDKKITEFFTRNNCFVYSIDQKRFFKNDDIFGGNTIASKNRHNLDELLSVN